MQNDRIFKNQDLRRGRGIQPQIQHYFQQDHVG